ncbi:MAG TPA: alanine dehydrogenase [Anaerolineae bacterium]|nr:alanine dehydrogenase [Anaerolineae bacterium]
MSAPQSIGFPRMKVEAGEKRVFLPEFIQFIANLGVKVYIEEGYGSRSGYSFADYKRASMNVFMCSREEAFQKDVSLILRSPRPEEFQLVKSGTILISMLHYPTRPKRIARLIDLGINSISLDSIADDNNLRMVENMKSVAWNGLEAAFDWLEKEWPGLVRPDKQPINVLILGTGMVGKHAIEAATKLGNVERNNDHIASNGPGAVAVSIGRNIASNPSTMKTLIGQADILVDATQRRNASKPVVPNDWIAWLPRHAVIVDLAVDPYTLDANPPVVRGIEGIPQGGLDQYVFPADDPKWDSLVPQSIPSKNRRTAVTCYSWPGVHPEACMMHYAQQLSPFMKVLFTKGYDGLSLEGDYFERALYRATLKAWMNEADADPKVIREAD